MGNKKLEIFDLTKGFGLSTVQRINFVDFLQ